MKARAVTPFAVLRTPVVAAAVAISFAATSVTAQEITVTSFGGCVPGRPEQGGLPAGRQGARHEGQGRDVHRHRRPAPQDEGGREHLGHRRQRLGQRGARRRRGLLEKLDYKVIDVSSFLPGFAGEYCVGGDVFSDGARLEHQDLRRQGSAELGRLLGREEISRQALLSQGRGGRARAGADGRRRAAGQGLRGAVATGRRGARDQEDQGAEAAHRGVVVLRRPARAAHEGRRGRHDHRLERPLRRGGQGRRQGRLHLQPGPARLRLLRHPQGRAQQGRWR